MMQGGYVHQPGATVVTGGYVQQPGTTVVTGGYVQQPGTTLVSGGYAQQPGTTVVVVQEPTRWGRRRYGDTMSMRPGIQLTGILLSLPVIICLGIFGGFFLLSGIINLCFTQSHVGVVLVVLGVLLIAGCIGLARYSKKNYQQNWNSPDNPGRVINRNPSPSPARQPLNPMQPAGVPYGVPPAGTQMPQYSPAGAGMPPAGGYGPVPMQPSNYPPPASVPGGANAYPPPSAMDYSSPGLQVPPTTLPGMTGDPSKPSYSEYSAPPAYAPDYKPPY